MISIVSYTDTSSDSVSDDEPETENNDQSCKKYGVNGVHRFRSRKISSELVSSGRSVCCDYDDFGLGTNDNSEESERVIDESCDCENLKEHDTSTSTSISRSSTTKSLNVGLGPDHHNTKSDGRPIPKTDDKHNESCIYSMPVNMISTSINQRAVFTQGAPKRLLSNFESHEKDTQPLPKKTKSSGQDVKEKEGLILPDSVKSMFGRPRQWVDDCVHHGNRVRSFPHVEGNWATHVYVPVSNDERLVSFINQLLMCLRPVKFEAMSEFHVSLSHTVVVRHHWIDPLVDSLRENFKILSSCVCDLAAVKLYRNDERTRTFVGLELLQDDTFLMDYVKAVNKSFKEFKLRSYYEKPLFHVSIGWCLGDELDKVTDDMLNKAKEMLADFCAANPDLSILFVQHICCRTGNKSFVLPLADSTR